MKVEAFRIEVDGKQQTLKSISDIKKAIRELRKSAENLDLTDPQQAKRLQEVNKTIGQLDATVKQNTRSQREFKDEAVAAGQTTASAYQRFQAELKTTRSALRDLEAAGRGNSDEAKNLRARLSELNDEQRRINRETKAGDNAYRQLTSQLAATQDRIKQLNAQKVLTGQLSQKESAELRMLSQEYTRLNGSVRQIEEGVGQFQRSVGQYQNALRGVAGAFNAAALAGGKLVIITEALRRLVRFARDAFSTFSEFSGSVQFLGVVSDATERQLGALRAEAERLGSITAFTANEVVGLQTTFARGGFDPRQIIDLGEATLNLAAATDEALNSTSDLVSIIANVYRTSADEARSATDALVGAFNNSTLQLNGFSESFTNVGGTAQLANIEFEAVTASLGVLSDAGERGARAGTRLGRIITELADENSKLSQEVGFAVRNTEDFERALDQLAESGIDLTKANELVSGQNARVLATLVQNRDGYNDLRESIEEATQATDEFGNVTGAAAIAASRALDSIEGDQRKLASATENLKLQFAGLFEGGARPLIQGITTLTNLIANSLQPAFSFLQAATQPVRDAMNELVDLIVEMISPLFQATDGFGIMGKVVEGLVGIFRLQYEVAALVIRNITRMIRVVRSIIGSVVAFTSALSELITGMTGADSIFSRFIANAVESVKLLGRFIINLPNILMGVISTLDQFAEEVTKFFENIGINVRIAAASIKGVFSSAAREEARELRKQRDAIADEGTTFGERLSNAFKEGFNSSAETLSRAGAIQEGMEESSRKAKAKAAAEEVMKNFAKEIEGASRDELQAIKSTLERNLEELDLSVPADVEKFELLQQQLSLVDDALSELGDSMDTLGAATAAAEGSISALKNELSELNKEINDQNLSDTELEDALRRVIELEGEIEQVENRIIEARNRITRQPIEPIQMLQRREISGEVEVSDDARRGEGLRLAIEREAEVREAALNSQQLTEEQRFKIVQESEERLKALRAQFRAEQLRAEIEAGELRGQALIDAQKELIEIELELNEFRNQQRLEQEIETQAEIEQIAKDGAKRVFDGIEQLRKESVEREINSEKEKYDALIEAAEGNEERQARLAEERDERVEELQREEFERGKRMSIAETLINGAQAIIKAFADLGPIAGAIAAGTIAATTAAQVVSISQQDFGQGGMIYDEGGMLQGPSHAQGGIKAVVKGRPIEMEGGEAVINKRTMRSRDRISLHGTPREIASSLNSYKNYGVKFARGGLVGFQDGGILAGQETPSADAVSGFVRLKQEDIRAIAEAVREGSTEGTIEGTMIAAEEKNRLDERVRRLERNTAL